MAEQGLESVPAALARWAACIGASVPLLGAVCATGVVGRRFNHALFRGWSEIVLRILRIEVDVEDQNRGSYPTGPLVFVLLNQASILEVCYWLCVMPVPFGGIMNIEYALIPLLGLATWAHGGIPIVRQWPWHARRGINKAIQRLRDGHAMVISIEGRRSPDGSLQPYKKGPIVMALEARASIIPIAFHGARDRLPVGEWRVRPGKVRLTLCEAIAVEGLTTDHRDALLERLRAVAEAELGLRPPR
jgi:1-acyl-sn-glycerol-3-phosphate acyltransferase